MASTDPSTWSGYTEVPGILGRTRGYFARRQRQAALDASWHVIRRSDNAYSLQNVSESPVSLVTLTARKKISTGGALSRLSKRILQRELNDEGLFVTVTSTEARENDQPNDGSIGTGDSIEFSCRTGDSPALLEVQWTSVDRESHWSTYELPR